MPRLSKALLIGEVVQAVYESGWNVLHLSGARDHPAILRVYNEIEGYTIRVYIWNLTHGGGSARPTDEYRIQVTGVDRFRQPAGELTLVLGWWEDVGVFAAFDYNKHSGALGFSPSMQIKEENLRKAEINGFSAHDKGNGEIAIALRPDFFVEYVANLRQLHQLGTSRGAVQAAEKVASGEIAVNNAEVRRLPRERQTVIAQVSKKLRESSFTRRVLTAYGFRCAFTGIHLKLSDAAHILPVKIAGSTDETSNGIALSPSYHRAYDRGLVTLDEEYRVIISEERMEQLKEAGLDGGKFKFTRALRPMIIVPPALSDRPNVTFVTESNRLRGWK